MSKNSSIYNMLSKSDFLSKISEYIDRSGKISRLCSEESIKRSNNSFLAVDIHQQYTIWKLEFCEILQAQKLDIDAKIFGIENAVPLLKSGIEYGDKDSIESRILIKSISVELQEKLKHLGEIYEKNKKNATKNVVNNNLIFLFNSLTGELSRYPKNIHGSITFSINKGRGKILKILIEEKEMSEQYVPTSQLTKKSGYENERKCREGIHKIREKVQEKFKNISGEEFIETRQAEGYRIGAKITVSFEDTP